MAEFNPRKNGEGYEDPTAYNGINGRAKGGEIYQYNEYEVLILRNQGAFSTVLRLVEFESPGSIPVDGSGIKYTNPAMLNYCYNDKLGRRINVLEDADYDRVMSSVYDALGGCPSPAPVPEQQSMSNAAIVQRLTDKVEALEEINSRIAREKVESEQAAAISRMKVEVLEQMYDGLLDRFLSKGCVS